MIKPAVLVSLVIIACSVYANLSFAVTNPANFRYFPPFVRGVNANSNAHLGGEYFQIAMSLYQGNGFAHPFDRPTGPTAWQPPVLPTLLAGLLWLFGGSRDAVMWAVVSLRTVALILTGLLVLAMAGPRGRVVSAVVYLAVLLCHFPLCFQSTHDSWLVLLAVDALIAGLCWLRPLERWRAVGWGVFGGVTALINPIVGLAWLALTAAMRLPPRAWKPLAYAMLAAVLTLAPWTVRNYLVLGRVIPTKSNLGYELYQSQCLQPDGLIQNTTFAQHPFRYDRKERKEYDELGEIRFVERKWSQFREAITSNPLDYAHRVADRFLAATVWYTPFDRVGKARRTWTLRLSRLTHPLPFLGLVVLLFSAAWKPLGAEHWTVVTVYSLYLLPYVGVSYYDRYAVPMLGVKALLIAWATLRWPPE